MAKITIEEAKDRGLKHYFTGKPCKRGHISKRYLSNKECVTCRSIKTQSYQEKGYFKNYREENTEKEKKYRKEYKKNNKDKVNAFTAKYRANKKNRVPKWVTSEDLWLIKEIYDLAALRSKITGVQWHVDHIIPINGTNVSGLHCVSNLQVIVGTANMSKNNKWCWENQK